MTGTREPAALLELARSAAEQAGRLLRDRRPARLEVADTKTSATDVVTEMDTRAERLITEVLLTARPGDSVLGEESGQQGQPRPGQVRWVVDPLDGTVNYLYGLGSWAVSIAAEVDGVAVAGVVEAPVLGETYWAVRGGGAYRNGGPISCRAPVPLAQALVSTGFGYTVARRRAQAEVAARVLPLVRDLRRGGSAAIDLCQVAAGRLDAHYERGLRPWDHAAGALIAAEAGAVVAGVGGRPAGEELLVAAAPGLFEPLLGLLTELGADRG